MKELYYISKYSDDDELILSMPILKEEYEDYKRMYNISNYVDCFEIVGGDMIEICGDYALTLESITYD